METKNSEPLISKYLHSKAVRQGIPLAGTFELTPRCNLDCRMCYVHLSEPEQKRRGNELTSTEWLEIASAAQKRGMLFLLLTGGEPLIRPDFPELLSELKKLGLMVSVNSNGTLLSGKIFDAIKKDPPFRFNITLYGASDETYRRLCGRPMFRTVTDNIKRLKEAGVCVKLNASITPYNCGDLEEIYRISRELDCPIQVATYMFPPIRRDSDSVGENDRFSWQDAARYSVRWDLLRFDEKTFRSRAEAMEKGLAVPDDRICDDDTVGEGVACRAGRSSFWINWNGDMTPCGMMDNPRVSVVEHGFDAAWEKTRQATAEIRLPPECTRCELKQICHVCASMCLTESGDFGKKPEYVCRMAQETARLTQAECERMNKK